MNRAPNGKAGPDMHHAEPYTDCAECSVRAQSFCGAIPPRSLEELSRNRRTEHFDRRQTIAGEGEPATSFFNIVSGVVKLCRSLPDGRTQIIGFRFPGEVFGISDTESHTTTAEALTAVTLCRFPRARLKRLVQTYPPAQTRLLEMNYRHLMDCEDQIFLLGRKTAREKVASFLLHYGGKFGGGMGGADQRMELPVTRAEIADFLGLTTETVSRILTSLVREKIITLDLSHSVRLLNADSLRRISGH